jgi:(p)ppGpp synthase/HD superfamily hydrolase
VSATTPPPHLTTRFVEALAFATVRHAQQRRKGTNIPYVAHLLGVCSLVLEHGGDEDTACAALLHDVVEDGHATLAELRSQFGPTVAAIVAGCSDTTERPKPPWRARKQRYLAHLREATPAMLLVSGCDKLHNARAILADYQAFGDALWERFNRESGGAAGQLWYYRELVEAFRPRLPPALLAQLDDVVTALERAVRDT